jgi:alpha-1,3-mannosyltransferase
MQELGATRVFLGVRVAVSDRRHAVGLLDQAVAESRPLKIAFANANSLTVAARSSQLRAALQDFCVLNDGIGLDIASRFKFGVPFPENLNGTDFLPFYLANSSHGLRLYLLGATPDVAETAAEVFRRDYPRHTVVGFHHGYLRAGDDGAICADIAAAKADVVLVSMGNPLQELWIAKNAAATGAKLLFGVGALFDFVSGRVPRAPQWLRSLRCEWIYRLGREPRRLWRRYLIGNAVFLKSVLRERNSALTAPERAP